jgi:hypothetical protein
LRLAEHRLSHCSQEEGSCHSQVHGRGLSARSSRCPSQRRHEAEKQGGDVAQAQQQDQQVRALEARAKEMELMQEAETVCTRTQSVSFSALTLSMRERLNSASTSSLSASTHGSGLGRVIGRGTGGVLTSPECDLRCVVLIQGRRGRGKYVGMPKINPNTKHRFGIEVKVRDSPAEGEGLSKTQPHHGERTNAGGGVEAKDLNGSHLFYRPSAQIFLLTPFQGHVPCHVQNRCDQRSGARCSALSPHVT